MTTNTNNTSQYDVTPLNMLGDTSPPAIAARSPTVPFSPISPTTTSPLPNAEPGFGLRQSSTNLAIQVDIVDIDDISRQSNNSIDRDHLTASPCLRANSTTSSTFDPSDLLLCLDDASKHQLDTALMHNGYKKLRKICDTMQGTMYEAIITDPYKRAKTGFERVAVKQTCKDLHLLGEAIQDNLRVLVNENIIKEAMILKYLTKDNRPNGGYICKFVEFFETDEHYYLVMEYVGDCNLQEFITECHKYIKQKKLKLSDYKKVIKFLFWQICVMIHWMHNDMNCCHLDLCLENIIVRDGNLIMDENTGNMQINPNVAVKLGDFGLAEIFSPEETNFTVDKCGLKDSFETTAPKVYNELFFDGMKSDIWSLGAILYKLSTGKCLYQIPDEQVDAGYYCTLNNKLAMHIEVHRLSKFFNKKMLQLIINMLNVNEQERYCAFDVLNAPWFESYYKKYALRIFQKSKTQKEQLKKQLNKMRNFPYYKKNN